MKKKQRSLTFDFMIMIGMMALTIVSLFFAARSTIEKLFIHHERINMIWIGTDWVDYSRHSDTLIFASYEPRTRFLDIMSIPRDTKIAIDGIRVRRINEVYAYFYRLSQQESVAAEKLKNVVEKLLSVDKKISVPFYLHMNYNGFIQAVDLLGGVPILIDEPMHYDDFRGNLHIHFDTGTVKLDGRKALEYI
ncbi:MAG: hypothetical protein GF384_02660, partial [Elusimicrobia bacterium]|nr:hypothetical protein [Elusimicrobiota bacterium]MBD3411859.1 hypothetical protein [Elusimicrobiota bacterium]